MNDWMFYLSILLLVVGMLGLYFGIIPATQKQEEIRKSMYTALGITTGLVAIYSVMSYMFFINNTTYTYPYLLIMNSLLLWIGISSLSISTINVSYAA
jgi:hypothetical protein